MMSSCTYSSTVAEFLFCYLAGHKTGAINCPINYRLAPGELALLLEDSRPEFLVYDTFLPIR